jgi:hypothetical protein
LWLPESTVQDKGLAERLLLAAKRFLGSPQGTFVSTSSRSIASSQLREAILGIEPQGIDLGPMLAPARKDSYRLLFQKASRTNAGMDWGLVKTVDVSWPPQIPVTGLTPGLYKVLELDRRGEPTGSDAWVLLVTPDVYAKTFASFAAAQNLVEGWSKNFDREWSRSFARAYLAEIAETTGGFEGP